MLTFAQWPTYETPFEVIQGQHFRYQWKADMRVWDVLCVNNTLCSKKVTPKFKSLQLRHILSELNILLVALIIIFPT